ncbi:MAG TPA: HD domain-containing phosphohydrolase [Acidimicrobiales bacterium]|nr:HD domain-containing phosphohydrolase [Acidimicrobiales bacterium]
MDHQPDTTEPSRSDGLARDTLLLLESFHSSAPVGFAFLDRQFRYVRVNEKLASLDGCSVAEHLGRTAQEVVPKLWPQVEPFFEQVLRTGETLVNLEVSGETPVDPGGVHHWATSAYAVHHRGRTVGLGVLVTDISERKRAEAALGDLMRATIAALAATVETRDPYTAGHQRRVSQFSRAVATKMGLDGATVTGVSLAAHIHDIGKIGVPAEILMRPSPLRPGEFDLVKDHCRAGREIIASISFPWPVAEMVYQHHERFDGTGYPQGLKGDEISLGARIISATDALEAMASHRPYRPAMGLGAAMSLVEAGRGSQFDSDVVDACTELFRAGQLELAEDWEATAPRAPGNVHGP